MNTDSSILSLIQQQPGGGGALLVQLLPFILIFGVFYLLIIRPQQRRQRQAQQEREALLTALKVGDKVVTSGGILGTVVAVREKEDIILLRIAQSVSIEIQRNAIAGLQEGEKKEVDAAK
jgi:preprotein translocase subunit YajC